MIHDLILSLFHPNTEMMDTYETIVSIREVVLLYNFVAIKANEIVNKIAKYSIVFPFRVIPVSVPPSCIPRKYKCSRKLSVWLTRSEK